MICIATDRQLLSSARRMVSQPVTSDAFAGWPPANPPAFPFPPAPPMPRVRLWPCWGMRALVLLLPLPLLLMLPPAAS